MPIECDEPDIGALGSAARKAQKRGRRVSDAAKVKPKLLLFSLGARKDAGCCQHAGADNLAHDRIIHGAHRRGQRSRGWLEKDRWFADSPVERDGFTLSLPHHCNFLVVPRRSVSWEVGHWKGRRSSGGRFLCGKPSYRVVQYRLESCNTGRGPASAPRRSGTGGWYRACAPAPQSPTRGAWK